ncbi:haloacid dehalogenase [Aureimonas ureilytica]|uniref:(S)-2-haloacid dehalogenase n=1 Tax=Aureimonas ureilytica TaxID=401562 RepID=A0A175RD54_9HYPH|nr:haloacid dehalogenase type II [Aureimonas ureilytica]KTQ96974.1 haloacid dehalogenase [Aureimonas ureilytica]
MSKVEVLFFDVLGTVVDWRGSIAAEARRFLNRNGIDHISAGVFADAWVARYDASVGRIRSGQRHFVPLDVLNMENLETCLSDFGVAPTGLAQSELQDLNAAWHRLKPWPDSVEGITKLRESYVVAPLSDGNTRLLVNMAKHAGLPWDTILGADISSSYKPMPTVYLRACEFLQVPPERAMLIAAHGYDLEAARQCGLKTAYVPRDNETTAPGDRGCVDSKDWDFEAKDLVQLAEIL